jgi:hypothetical protein
MHPTLAEAPVLELISEFKLYELLAGSPGVTGPVDDRLEASGVTFQHGHLYVIFDNSPHIARLGYPLAKEHPANALMRQRGESAGFEDLAYHPRLHRHLIIIEAVRFGPGVFKPRIEEYDDDFRFVESSWVDFPMRSDNKGLEGVAYVARGEEDYALGLCEGNRCRAGREGRKPGGGRLQIFRKVESQWEHVGTLKLPKCVPFEDYASLDLVDNRVAVVSQVSSALWLGCLKDDAWEWVDDGRVYRFPRSKRGKVIYGNVEGVAWIAPDQLVFVSDRRTPGVQPKRVAKKDQSIHAFNVPAGV